MGAAAMAGEKGAGVSFKRSPLAAAVARPTTSICWFRIAAGRSESIDAELSICACI